MRGNNGKQTLGILTLLAGAFFTLIAAPAPALAQQATTIDDDGNTGLWTSMAVDANGRVAVAYVQHTGGNTGSLKVWYDDAGTTGVADNAGNGIANGGEIRDIDDNIIAFDEGNNPGNRTSDTAILFYNNNLAVAYTGSNNNVAELRLWYDANGDGVRDNGEIYVLDDGSGNNVGYDPSMTTVGGDLVVAYHDTSNQGGALNRWRGDANDMANGTGDIQVVATSAGDAQGDGAVGLNSSMVPNSTDVIHFNDAGVQDMINGYLMRNDGYVVNTNTVSGRLNGVANSQNLGTVISYNGMDLAGSLHLIRNGNDVVIDGNGGVGGFSAITVMPDGNLAISYYDSSNQRLKLWRDSDLDGDWDQGEIEVLDDPDNANVGFHTSIGIVNGDIAVAYYDLTNGALKFYSSIPLPEEEEENSEGNAPGTGSGIGLNRVGGGSGSCFVAVTESGTGMFGLLFLLAALAGAGMLRRLR